MTSGGLLRMDINDPEDLQVLIDRGLIWRSGPKTMQKVLDSIVRGLVKRNPEKEPPEVRAYLDKVKPLDAPAPELAPADETEPVPEPVEPTVEAPAGPPLA